MDEMGIGYPKQLGWTGVQNRCKGDLLCALRLRCHVTVAQKPGFVMFGMCVVRFFLTVGENIGRCLATVVYSLLLCMVRYEPLLASRSGSYSG